MRYKTLFIALVMVLAILLAAWGGAALAQTPDQPASQAAPRTLTVNGNAQVALTPDIAYIYIGVHTENQDASQALADNNAQVEQVVELLRSSGVAARDIRTSNFSIYPSQQYGRDGELQGNVYMVDNTVYVTLRDLQQVGSLLNAVVESGANSINGIQFDVADRQAALSQARQQAVDDARQQAQELAQAAGVSLGEIQSISYYGNNYPPGPIFYGREAIAADAQVPISTGELMITADVNVVYQIQ